MAPIGDATADQSHETQPVLKPRRRMEARRSGERMESQW